MIVISSAFPACLVDHCEYFRDLSNGAEQSHRQVKLHPQQVRRIAWEHPRILELADTCCSIHKGLTVICLAYEEGGQIRLRSRSRSPRPSKAPSTLVSFAFLLRIETGKCRFVAGETAVTPRDDFVIYSVSVSVSFLETVLFQILPLP